MKATIPTGTEENENPPIAGSVTLPPAAEKVLSTPVEETDAGELVKTKRELAEEREARKKEQTRINVLEDENRRLKNVPNLMPEKKAEAIKKSFLSGARSLVDEII